MIIFLFFFIYFGRKGSAVTGSELRNIINEYVRKNNLQDEKNKRYTKFISDIS